MTYQVRIFFFILIVNLLFIDSIKAQKLLPQWKWAISTGDNNYDYDCEGNSITVDSSGNTYITGRFDGTINFGNIELTALRYGDIFVAKLNKKQQYEWAIRAGGLGGSESGVGIILDKAGNTYITGFFEDSADFGNTVLKSKGNDDLFIAKIDNNGKWLWAISAGGKGNDISNSIAIDSSGYIYLTGWFRDTANFGNTTISANGTEDIFVAKIDSNGQWQWIVNAGGIHGDRGHSLTTDLSGNIYLTGWAQGNAAFGDITISADNYSILFIAKLNNNGEWRWAVRAEGSVDNGESGNSIATDSFGNVYVTGSFISTAKFGKTILETIDHEDIFVTKLDSSGTWIWAVNAGGKGKSIGNSIVLNSGFAYITGHFEGGAIGFPANVKFANTTLTSPDGSNRLFVAKLDKNGQWIGATGTSGSWHSGKGISITNDQYENLYVTGFFTGEATFGRTTLEAYGSINIYISQLRDEIVTSTKGYPQNDKAFIIYPNPASNILTLESTKLSNTPINIKDITGRQIMQYNYILEGKLNLDISTLANGIYFISVNQSIFKFIKQ